MSEADFNNAATPDTDPMGRLALARLLFERGHCERARALALVAWEDAKKQREASLRAACCSLLGEIARSTGDHESAARYRQLEIAAALDAADDGLSRDILLHAAITHCERKEYHTALRRLHQAAGQTIESGDRAGTARLREFAGRLQRALAVHEADPRWN